MAPIKTNPYLIILIRSLYVVATSNAMRLPDTNNQPTLSGRVGHSSISTPAIIITESAVAVVLSPPENHIDIDVCI